MPALSWATKEQQAWLTEYQQTHYLPLQAKKNYTGFWHPFFEAFAVQWPEREVLFPGIPEANLTTEQKELLGDAIKERKNKLTNWMRVHSRPKKPPTAAAVVDCDKAVDLLSVINKHEKRLLSPLEVFSKLYYKSHVKDSVKAACPGSEDDSKVPVDVIRKATIAAWENMQNDEPEKALIVMEECKRRKEERVKDLEERENPTPEQIAASIRRAPSLLINALQKLQKSTGWSFTLLFGGPDPDLGGKLSSASIHLGETEIGGNFGDCYVEFDERVMKPYHAFLTRLHQTGSERERSRTPAAGFERSRTATPAPAAVSERSRTTTPAPAAVSERSRTVTPALDEGPGSYTETQVNDNSRAGTPSVVSGSTAPFAPVASNLLTPPLHSSVGPVVPTGILGPVTSWPLKPDTPFSFDKLYVPLGGDTQAHVSGNQPILPAFTWPHSDSLAGQGLPVIQFPQFQQPTDEQSRVSTTQTTLSQKRVSPPNDSDGSDALDFGRGKRVRSASKRAEEANLIGRSG